MIQSQVVSTSAWDDLFQPPVLAGVVLADADHPLVQRLTACGDVNGRIREQVLREAIPL